MKQETQYSRLSLLESYQFLEDCGLKEEADEIKNSPDRFMSYTSTLRRAKIIHLLEEKNLMDQFVEEAWPSGKTKKGLSRIRFMENLYQRFLDNKEGVLHGEDESSGEDISIEESQFAYETDLRDYLATNLHVIETGLKLYESESGTIGIEYIIPETRRRIDILAVDKNGDYVVIELKVSRGYEKAIGQALYYQSMVKQMFNAEKVRIILIAREISEELRMGTKHLSDIQLFEYQLSLTLNQVSG